MIINFHFIPPALWQFLPFVLHVHAFALASFPVLLLCAHRSVCLFSLPVAMQPSLPFSRITAHDAAQQRQRIALEVAALPPTPPVAPTPKRAVGRPKRQRQIPDALTEQLQPPQKKNAQRGTYTLWFASPYINDILAAYHRAGKHPKSAVKALQHAAPDDHCSDHSKQQSRTASMSGQQHRFNSSCRVLVQRTVQQSASVLC